MAETGVEQGLEGRERVSATVYLVPGTWMKSLVNSEMKARWRCCLADHGGEEQNRACVRGLWSVKMVNSQPSRRKRKLRMEE